MPNEPNELIYRADLEKGDGISVCAGHKVYPIFAFAENCWNARIFIVSYPEFNQISIFEPKDECIYIGLTFSENEHLIALTGMPHYKLQVWFWRTHDLLVTTATDVITDKQKIVCNHSLPLTVAQFAFIRGELIVWEIHGTQKFCKLIRRKIDLNFIKSDGPFNDVYTIEGNILIVNKCGEIFNVVPSTGVVNTLTKWNRTKDYSFDTCIAFLRNGILASGPDGFLKYFKKQKFVWNEICHVHPSNPFVAIKGYLDNEATIGITNDNELYKITLTHDGEKIQMTRLYQYEQIFTDFVFVYPHGDYIVAINEINEIHAIHVRNGEKISQLLKNISMIQIVVKANPKYPLVAIGNRDGNVYCVSLLNPLNPTLLTEFLLSRQPIKSIRFSNNGNFMIVNDHDYNFFIISCTPGEKMSVLHHVKEEIITNEFFAIESRQFLSIFFLTKCTHERNDKVTKFDLKLEDLDTKIDCNEYELAACYNTIIPKFDHPNEFYGLRKNGKYVEILKIDKEIVLENIIQTNHFMKHLEGWNDGHHLVLWSADGIISIYDIHSNHKLLSCFVAGNRHQFGISKAKCDPKRKHAIVLDHSGNLICFNLNIMLKDDETKRIHKVLNEANEIVHEKFAKTTSGGFPGLNHEFGNKKFTDLKDERAYQMEAEKSEDTRMLLHKKIKDLRQKIKKLLDENEKNVDEEKLEIQEFNLDLETTEIKEQEAKSERDQQDKKMMEFIEAQNALNRWIIIKCWQPLAVKGTKLRGMFLNAFVENYPLLPDKNIREIEKIELIRAIENSVARNDAFLPCRPILTM
jgi:WD40 repeat protein